MEKCNDQNNPNCCDSTSESGTNCCSTTEQQNSKSIKKKLGITLLGLAILLAITSAFSYQEHGDNKNTSNTTESGSCGVPSIKDLKWLKTNKKVAFILLPGTDEAQNKKLSDQVKNTVDELNETDGSAYYQELTYQSKEYKDLNTQANISQFPSVAVLGRGCTSSVLSSKINSTKLIKAYVAATTPASSCSSGSSGSSCCNK